MPKVLRITVWGSLPVLILAHITAVAAWCY